MPIDPAPDPPPSQPGPRYDPPRRVFRVGVAILLVSVALMLLPLTWGRWSVNRYLVAFGFVGACLGLSLVLNGAWDWVARRRRGRG